MVNRLLKYYERESQADLDAIQMKLDGWLQIGYTRWSHAARKWEVEYEMPAVSQLMGRVA